MASFQAAYLIWLKNFSGLKIGFRYSKSDHELPWWSSSLYVFLNLTLKGVHSEYGPKLLISNFLPLVSSLLALISNWNLLHQQGGSGKLSGGEKSDLSPAARSFIGKHHCSTHNFIERSPPIVVPNYCHIFNRYCSLTLLSQFWCFLQNDCKWACAEHSDPCFCSLSSAKNKESCKTYVPAVTCASGKL